MQNQQTININQRLLMQNQRSIFSKFGLPILLMLSFVWLNLYTDLADLNSLTFTGGQNYVNLSSYLIFSVLIAGIFDYLIFELLFFIYRLFIGFSIYSFMIPKNIMLDKFRFWYIVRNIFLGFLFNIRFFLPYVSTYLCVFELIFNFGFIILLYFDLSKNYVEPLIGQFVFKTLAVPVILYEVYVVIRLVVGVLWWKN